MEILGENLSIRDYLQSFSGEKPEPEKKAEESMVSSELTPLNDPEAIFKQIEELTQQITNLSLPKIENYNLPQPESQTSRSESRSSFRSSSPEEANFLSVADALKPIEKMNSFTSDDSVPADFVLEEFSDTDSDSQYSDVIDMGPDLGYALELEEKASAENNAEPEKIEPRIEPQVLEPEKIEEKGEEKIEPEVIEKREAPESTAPIVEAAPKHKSIFQIIQEGTLKLGEFFKQEKTDNSLFLLKKTLNELREAADSLQPKPEEASNIVPPEQQLEESYKVEGSVEEREIQSPTKSESPQTQSPNTTQTKFEDTPIQSPSTASFVTIASFESSENGDIGEIGDTVSEHDSVTTPEEIIQEKPPTELQAPDVSELLKEMITNVLVPEEAIADFNATASSMETNPELELQTPDTVQYLVQSPPENNEQAEAVIEIHEENIEFEVNLKNPSL